MPDQIPALEPGMRVLVPVGPRFLTGFIVEENSEPEEGIEIRPIADLLDPENFFSPPLIQLTRWMADYYLADWDDVLKAALPPALDVRPDTVITITHSGKSNASQDAILRILHEKQSLPLKELYKLFGYRGTFSRLRDLEANGFVEILAGKRITRRGYNMIEIVRNSEPPAAKKSREFYDYLKSQPGAVLVEELPAPFQNASALIRKLAAEGNVRRFWVPASPPSLWPEIHSVKKLNAAQEKVHERIRAGLGKFGVFLLHGVTGSGKTEIYLRLASEVLASGKSVLILVPEIALLPLIVHRARKALEYPMSILHSELSDRERVEEWQKTRQGKVHLVFGTRSAVFAPLRELGLVVIDEEHDGAYKQNEYPRYHARETAIMRSTFEKCPVVLGSATPSVESFFNSGNGKYEYLSLPYRVESRKMPHIHLVDMKQEYKESGNPIFSRYLLEQITKKLDRKEQILILLNRRGYASSLMCRECGYVLECPNCSITLTYHKFVRRMRCHYCDYSRLAPRECEKCGSGFLNLSGVGTERIVESLKKSYPSARIERFDRDATRKKGSIVSILTRFALKEIDVLVGTQMLAKGHDFPDVTLVGVVSADSSIGIPDFRASERLFQLLTQVAGRSGRGNEPGLVVLQTYHPDHYAIQCAIQHNYEGFYEKEIRFRRLMQYPPFQALANVVFSGKDSKGVLEEAREFGKLILAFKTEPMKMLGPAIAPLARLSGSYRFQILLKSPIRKDLRECLRSAIRHFRQREKTHSQVSVDIDLYSIV